MSIYKCLVKKNMKNILFLVILPIDLPPPAPKSVHQIQPTIYSQLLQIKRPIILLQVIFNGLMLTFEFSICLFRVLCLQIVKNTVFLFNGFSSLLHCDLLVGCQFEQISRKVISNRFRCT